MQKMYCFKNSISFIKKGITSLSLLILLSETVYSSPIDKNTDRKTGYNFFAEIPSFTSWPKSKREGSYSIVDCSYSLSANSAVTSGTGIGTVTVTTGEACEWTATKNVSWITFTTGLSGTGNGSVGYSYTANTEWASRTGRIIIAGQAYTVTQTPRPLSPDSYEPNNTVEQPYSFTPIFAENASTFNISPANFHAGDAVDIYKINLGVGYSYRVRAILYDKNNQTENSNHTIDAKISYSTNGSTWNELNNKRLGGLTVQGGGNIYFKILPLYQGSVGSYAVKIDINIAGSSTDCTFGLSSTSNQASSETGSDQITVTTTSSCFWTAFTDYSWITLTSGQSGTGSGSVAYTYKANMSTTSREGTISIAGQTFMLTLAGRPLVADSYEPNNTVEEVAQASTFTPTFTENASTVSISQATCHNSTDIDIDIYKINLEAGYSYTFNGVLYDMDNNQDNHTNYTLDVKSFYSTDGSTWINWGDSQLSNKIVHGEIFYLKINADKEREGTYAAKIDINRTVDCSLSLSPATRKVSSEAGNGLVTVRTNPLCTSSSPWTATVASSANWIMLTSGLSGTGNGTVGYSYTANTQLSSRTGTITIAGRTYTVTQLPPSLTPDSYEGSTGNNIAAQAYIFPQPVFSNENAGTISISEANCHNVADVDIYKINLEAGYSYIISGVLYDQYNQTGGSNYTLDVRGFYSTNGTNWTSWRNSQLSDTTVQTGTHYLKIQPTTRGNVGTYAARIDIKKAATAGCTYTLLPVSIGPTEEEGNGQINVTTGPSCVRAATSNKNWITLTSGQSGTGSGSVAYTYKANMATGSRTGTITIARQTFTINQAGRPLVPDNYEPNNTVAEITQAGTFAPTFTENASTISISPATCHINTDIDIYKINLEAGYSYTLSGELCDTDNNRANHTNYTLDVKSFYSTDGSTWINWGDRQLSNKEMQGGVLYLKIEPSSSRNSGTYAAKIDINRTIDCSAGLLPASSEVSSEAGNGLVTVTTSLLLCTSSPWTATVASSANWITLTSGKSGTSSGSVAYTYKANMATGSRTGTITIANQTFSITQAGLPLVADNYEPNNTVAVVSQASTFTPTFTDNVRTLLILRATCHIDRDVDIYQINLGAGYSYTLNGDLYNLSNQIDNSNYTLDAKISYSTNSGSTWSRWQTSLERERSKLVQAGTLYLKIEPSYRGYVGTYAAKIDIKRATTIGCTYVLPLGEEEVTWEAKTGQQVEVRTSSSGNLSCVRTATSNVDWITLTSGQSGTGTGYVVYSCNANTSNTSRTGTIAIAGKTYTVTQGIQPDTYEPNNTVEYATSLTAIFTNHASTLSISGANCHNGYDIDIYQINLEAGYHYTISGALYDIYNKPGNINYTINADISYSTNGSGWNAWGGDKLPNRTVTEGGTLYLKIEPHTQRSAGTYAANINIRRTAGCTYSLSPGSKRETLRGGTGRITVTASSLCTSPWTAASNETWITLTSGHSTTGSGYVDYSYTANTEWASRTGTITIANKPFTLTQLPLSLTPDRYEGSTGNNTTAQAHTFPQPVFNNKNESTLSISEANCHNPDDVDDVDFYKINLEAGYIYTIGGVLYDRTNQTAGSSYTLDAKISYSTNGSYWKRWLENRHLSREIVQAGTLYFKIEPYYTGRVGTYDARIDIVKAATVGCNYTLLPTSRGATVEEDNGQINVTTDLSCLRTATSNETWITLTSGQSGTGSGSVDYTYKANRATSSRTGTISIADKTFTITQAGRPLASDNYEPNNTIAEIAQAGIFTPTFTENASTISISSATCHNNTDIDIYKINLEAGYSYTLSGMLYDTDNNQANHTNYTLNVNSSYSTDGTTWNEWGNSELSRPAVQGTLYIKIAPHSSGHTGTYAARIDIIKAATIGCTYTLPVVRKEMTWEAKTAQQAVVRTSSSAILSCIWTATSNVDWITLTSGLSGTGNGQVVYSCTENTTLHSRTGTISMARQTYTVIQEPRPFTPDNYEVNNTVAQASLLTATFTENTSTVSISANCHNVEDVDFYKINLDAGYSYTISGALYDSYNQINNSNYTLNAGIYYSTDGSTWNYWEYGQLSNKTVRGGTLYLKVTPSSTGNVGTYGAEIVLKKAATTGCVYNLPSVSKKVTSAAGSVQEDITTGSSCFWAVTSTDNWITLTSDQSGTGSGTLAFSYTENTTLSSRTETISIADRTYTVTQLPPPLTPDGYEPNNTGEQASLLTPAFTENATTISISSANCHNVEDVDFYKINLEAGYSYTVGGALYGTYNQINNSHYTLNTKIFYSTDSVTWNEWKNAWLLSNKTIQGGETFYIKIEPDSYGSTGSYEARINLSKTAVCTYNLSVKSKEATSEAGTGLVNVMASSLCTSPWTATSNANWITLTSGQSGTTGSREVGYSYLANTTLGSRTGTITMATRTYTVTQAGIIQPDSYESNNTVAEAGLRPLIPTFTQTTGTLSILANFHSKEDVDIYKITLGPDFYTFSVLYEGYETYLSYSTDGSNWNYPSRTTGNQRLIPVVQGGALYLKIEPYTYRWIARTYSVKIDINTVASSSCTYTLPITSREVTAGAGSGKVDLTTDASCAWAAVSNADWIKVTSIRSTAGSGNVDYSYEENRTPNSRAGTITVASRTYTVTQAPIQHDAYEENNTMANASLLIPLFTQNRSTISISANCHVKADVDIYKIDTGMDTYAISMVIQERSYSFDTKISYSTNAGSTWTESTDSKFQGLTVQGIIYLKIEPKDKSSDWRSVGSYKAGIDINKAATSGCTYSLSAVNRQVTWEAGAGKVDMETTESCVWSAVSHAGWISLASDRSITGSGSMDYSYTENTSGNSRTGRITVAGQTYTVTQAPIQADGYEENNTVEQAGLHSSFTPVFTQNTSSISISPANCHTGADVDIYKINLGTDSCIVRGALYDSANQINNSHYTLNAKISYSTDGADWSDPEDELPNLTARETLYLKIVAATGGKVGSYAMRISVNTASVAGCAYRLSAANKQATWEAGSDRVSVSTTSSCVWAATTNARWITVASGSRTGSGSVSYSYKENTTTSSRTGRIMVAGNIYTVTQAPLQADACENNNTVEQANLRPSLTPVFTQNTSRISISSVNCHTRTDVDIYKINLGTDSCVVSGALHHRHSRYDYNYDNLYSLEGKISYSTDGSLWKSSRSDQFSNLGVKGSLYLKIEPYSSGSNYNGKNTGSYAVKIEINKAVTADCTYSLSTGGREATAEAGAGQAEVTTNSQCAWTAASNADWISLNSGPSGTGSGSVGYTYTENTAITSRTGTITAAGKTYTITQAAAQLFLPDRYEPNDTKESAWLFTPVFTQNTSTLSISAANCHHVDDVDIYKINLGTEYNSYTVIGTLYDRNSDKKNHTLNALVSYSTDGSTWNKPESGRLWGLTVAGGILYLKIVPYYSDSYSERRTGSYAAKIDITGGCTYSLSPVSRQATSEAGAGKVTVTTHSSDNLSCPWAASSNVDWITFTSVQSGTATGNVGYAYTKNRSNSSRTGTLTIAGQTCTVTQEAAPSLAPDGYEENNTLEEARLLMPVFTQNTGTVSISPANCHNSDDVDVYKINLGNDYDSYTVNGVLYDRNHQIDNSHYTLDGILYFSTNDSRWPFSESSRSPNLTVASGETFYLAISSALKDETGNYAVKIDITGGCTYSLPVVAGEVAYEAGSGQIAVTVNSSGNVSCPRTATSNEDWITLTSGQSESGSGNVGYTYTENTTISSRTGTITVAGHTYTVTQTARPLSPDAYEPNNTVAKATLLNPVFTQNASTLSILQVNCHNADDVDVYKINLETGSYTVSAMLSDFYNDNNYTLDAKISYSTDGATWSESKDSQWTGLSVQGGMLYLRIEPFSGVGTYAAKIDILKVTEDCTYSLPVTLKQATYEAGSGQITVTTDSSCAWTATANVTWITFTSDQSKTGSGNVDYSYPENMSMDSRTGIITIAGHTYTVTQPAHPLSADEYEENNTVEQVGARSSFTPVFTQKESSISISPANCHHIEDVDIYKINLETGYSYAVSAVLSDRSTRINNNNYTLDARIFYSTDGSAWSKEYRQLPNLAMQGGTLYLKIAPYYYGNRVGFYTMKIDIKITDVCAYTLPATSKEVTAAAGTGKIEVTATGGSLCGWTATSNTDWLTIKSGQSGKGSGSTEYACSENNTEASRTGTITVAGQIFTVTQSVVVCNYELSPTSKEVTATAGTGKIEVTAGSSCVWAATANTDWITITSGQSGKGSGSTEYAYSENNTEASRTGTITVADQTFTVNQNLKVVMGIETTGSMKIFPNPAKDFVTIDFSGTHIKCVSVKISNQLGQVLYVQDSPGQTIQIPLKGFTGGVYFILLQGEEKTWVQKLIVK